MKKIYNICIIISLILAIICGVYFPSIMKDISFLGTIYINLLKFMVVPIIFTTIMVTIYKSKGINGKLILRTITTFIIMFLITFLITSLITSLIKPGIGFVFESIEYNDVSKLKVSDVLVRLFPSNIITMFQNNSIFGTIIFAIIFGICASKVSKGKDVINFFEGLKNIFYKILEYVMYLTPIGIFSLVGNMISSYKLSVLNMGIKYILVAYLCSIIVFILVMMLPVLIIKKINAFTYFKKISKVLLMTITTCSSVATLPTTIKVCKENFKVKRDTTDVIVPLGCTINMCGGAVSFALLGIFCCQLYGVDITLTKFLIMITSATLINMAAPGIPNGGISIGATYLLILGVPLTFIGFYSGIYKLLDIAYTTLNVTGDITAGIIVDKINDNG